MKTNPNDFCQSVIIGFENDKVVRSGDGLTKRELIAAIALSGLAVQAIPGRHNNFTDKSNAVMQAKCAVALADALVAELNREPEIEAKPCARCKGSGVRIGAKCGACDGTGQILRAVE